MKIGELFAQLGSIIAGFMFMKAILDQYFPHHLKNSLQKHTQNLFTFLSPYIQITFNEFSGERLLRNEAYSAIESYLRATTAAQARRLKADVVKNSQKLSLSMDDNEEVGDEYKGVKVYWASGKHISKNQQPFSFQPVINDDKRFYNLKFHKKFRPFIIETYLNHVMKEGNAMRIKNRQRKLYTNNGSTWSPIPFEHPASFETLAMEDVKKRDVVNDLLAFSTGESFYSRIGRAWKRGYLLYGPPGTGKSTMIAAMANLLSYDLYDLELTSVKDNTELKKLLIATASKGMIVIEDIDCSSHDMITTTTTRRKDEGNDALKINGKVTLSGLLNFIDGLWSACGGERIIVFTTNHIEKLDPALIRRGRMDMHIEMSYCEFGGFKVLAKNYLGLEWHDLFPRIEDLFGEVKITPADVAENLMPKSVSGNVGVCLRNLIVALEGAEKKHM